MKDGIDNFIVHGQADAVNSEQKGTKVSAHYPLALAAGEARTLRLRLSDQPLGEPGAAISEQCGAAFETVFMTRHQEADEFYATVIPASFSADESQCYAPGSGRDAVVQAVL